MGPNLLQRAPTIGKFIFSLPHPLCIGYCFTVQIFAIDIIVCLGI